MLCAQILPLLSLVRVKKCHKKLKLLTRDLYIQDHVAMVPVH